MPQPTENTELRRALDIDVDVAVDGDWDPGAPERGPVHVPRVARRFWVALTFASLFFAGASFTAFGGDQVAKLMQSDQADSTSAAAAADSSATSDATAATDSTASADASASSDSAASTEAAAPAAAPAAEAAPTADTNVVKSQDSTPTSLPTPAASSSSSSSASADASSQGQAQLPSSVKSPSSNDDAAAAAANHVSTHAARDTAHAAHEVRVAPPAARPVQRVRQQLQAPKPKPDPEVNQPGVSSVIWLNRALPDPTPPAARLTSRFAANLTAASHATGADWALVLGVLRAEGANGSVPAGRATLVRLGRRLVALERAGRSPWDAAAAFVGTTSGADRALALAHYNHAVGLWALVHGLEAAKKQLTDKVLSDSRISVYGGGRTDLARGRVDVRVVVVMEYLAESFGQVTVSCLVSGHRLYARPGVVSAHIYGRAVDIASLGGESILGNQQPGGITEHAVRDLLLLPGGLLPKQVISLLAMGGPSFALADHYNHIHVGY